MKTYGMNPELSEGDTANLKDLLSHPGWPVFLEIQKKQIEDLRDACEMDAHDVRFWQGKISGIRELQLRIGRAVAPRNEARAQEEVFEGLHRLATGRDAGGGY